tara:strand:- start:1192 stop:1434 length:243 start_codon:yes stop_codon:yes gene_type:complete
MSDEKMRVVARFPRSATTELVVQEGEYWNIEVIDIRWFNEGKPTRKGVRINKDELENLLKILNRIGERNVDKNSKDVGSN